MASKKNDKTAQKLAQLKEILTGKKTMLVGMQDFPDPDALASAAAMRELGHKFSDMQCTVTSGGIVGRAENRALTKYLNLSYRPFREIDTSRYDVIVLVDTQAGTGNNALPRHILPHIVIDHHAIRKTTRSSAFTDIRKNYGATCTIMYEYLVAAGIEIDPRLATALVYGIRSDTHELGRESSREDIAAFLALYPLANKRMLSEIRFSDTPRSYFRMLGMALANATSHGHSIISCAGKIDIPDIIGEIADLTLRDENTRWSLCYGYFDNRILLSLRTSDADGNAGAVMSKIVKGKGTGGGHTAMAGGQIPMDKLSSSDEKKIGDLIKNRFLKALKISDREGSRLIES